MSASASDLSNQPHVYPPGPDPHRPEVPPFSRCPFSRITSPRRSVPSKGARTPGSPLRRSPFFLASGPSPARRVPKLHRLHGAAGSRPDPFTAPSSPGTSSIPPSRPSHTSAFRPYRKPRAARERGGAARAGPRLTWCGHQSRGALGRGPGIAEPWRRLPGGNFSQVWRFGVLVSLRPFAQETQSETQELISASGPSPSRFSDTDTKTSCEEPT